MPIDWSVLRSLTARAIISALVADGFELRHQKGSHRRYRHQDGRRVTVSFHRASETFAPKTLRKMIENQAKWSEEDLKRLGIVK